MNVNFITDTYNGQNQLHNNNQSTIYIYQQNDQYDHNYFQQQHHPYQQQENNNIIQSGIEYTNYNRSLDRFQTLQNEPVKNQSKKTSQKTVEQKVKKISRSDDTCHVCEKTSEKIIFAYNAQMCEACKKFYQRATNKSKGKGISNGQSQTLENLNSVLEEYKCEEKNDGKTSSRYRRLKKCIELQMTTGS